MLLALLLATAPAPAPDAPLEQAEEVRTAILELPSHSFVARGAGCFLPAGKCVSVGQELAGLRQRALQGQLEPATPWQVLVGFGVGLVAGLALGIYGTVKLFELGLFK